MSRPLYTFYASNVCYRRESSPCIYGRRGNVFVSGRLICRGSSLGDPFCRHGCGLLSFLISPLLSFCAGGGYLRGSQRGLLPPHISHCGRSLHHIATLSSHRRGRQAPPPLRRITTSTVEIYRRRRGDTASVLPPPAWTYLPLGYL